MCTLLDGALTWWNSYVKQLDWMLSMKQPELALLCPGKGDCFKADQDPRSNSHGADLMDIVVRSKAIKDADNKRKWEDD
ncbi:hypothetical protein Tco_0083332 [Tanacetum coccineum]